MNDVITGGSTQVGSTAEQYYRWMLMKEKLDLQDRPGGTKGERARQILGTYSEKLGNQDRQKKPGREASEGQGVGEVPE